MNLSVAASSVSGTLLLISNEASLENVGFRGTRQVEHWTEYRGAEMMRLSRSVRCKSRH